MTIICYFYKLMYIYVFTCLTLYLMIYYLINVALVDLILPFHMMTISFSSNCCFFNCEAMNSAGLGWFMTFVVISCLAGVGVTGFIFYKYRLRVSSYPIYKKSIIFLSKMPLIYSVVVFLH